MSIFYLKFCHSFNTVLLPINQNYDRIWEKKLDNGYMFS